MKGEEMKTKLKFLFLGLVISLFYEGCSNDENQSSETSNGHLVYQNTKYPTPNGLLVFKELINSDLCLYDLNLYSSNFTFNSTDGEITDINGTGQIITFYIVSPIQLTDVNNDGIISSHDILLEDLILDEGDYSSSNAFIPHSFEADFITNASATSVFDVYSILSGTIHISKSGDVYEITYAGLDESSLNVSGYYKGKLNVLRNP
jgi:hypothetical protein